MSGQYRHLMNDGSHATNVRPANRWVDVLNESWPKPELARQLRELPSAEQIPVTARVVFKTGEEQLPGLAVYWITRPTKHVRVRINDARLVSGGLWLDPSDITRAV